MKRTKLFFDTKFTGLHQNTTLISLGIVSEDGKEFYAEFLDFDEEQLNPWIRENVLSKLLVHPVYGLKDKAEVPPHYICGDRVYVKQEFEKWLMQFNQVELWGYCMHYDMVLFNQLWGGAFQVPRKIPYIPFDICTLFRVAGIDPDISRAEFCGYTENETEADKQKHNALFDAHMIRVCYQRLEIMTKGPFGGSHL